MRSSRDRRRHRHTDRAAVRRVLMMMLKSVIGSWTEHHLIVIGMLFMIVVIALPGGIIGLMRDRIVRRLDPKGAS